MKQISEKSYEFVNNMKKSSVYFKATKLVQMNRSTYVMQIYVVETHIILFVSNYTVGKVLGILISYGVC